jgi:hypothetical protein
MKGLALILIPSILITACTSTTVPSQRSKAFPARGQDLSHYKEDVWACDNAAVGKSDSVSSYWWAGIIGMAIAKSNIEGKENSLWARCMEAKGYRVAEE